jgi:uncharacterized protein
VDPFASGAGGVARFRGKPPPAEEATHHRLGKVPFWRIRPGVEQETSPGLWALKPVLLDTGVIVALLDRSENFHQACADAVQEMQAPLITCEAVIAESCYLLRSLAGAPEAVIQNVAAGIFQVAFQLSREAVSVKQVLRKYRDRQIDLADACLICLANDFGTGDILTLDQDFAIYRWGKNKPFRILLSQS